MPGSTINFTRWLERLGFKDGRQPEVIRAIQPVQVVSDASFLVSPLLPPSGIVGGLRGSIPAVFTTFEIYGGQRGGTAVEVEFAQSGGIANVAVQLTTAQFPMANLVAIVPQEFRPGRSCQFRCGTIAVGLGSTLPNLRSPNNAPSQVSFYVPPGQFGYVASTVAALQYVFSCVYTEYDAQEGAS